ncbi:uncharacterized protein OCT59_027049 [Rhizophagus irregularis]|uniref:F-box domain-containing protein n=2 Tax=Rhizophagus irregularis TaxID=588596 RepID=A0A015IB41_RHIIW|nr:hypothetical protein GLOIN_2v1784270 [Rhizophagus irregularis DAOM 181602=DAOM 197198]EXX51025.1 hypothetical protein RirG_265320 [Rhizophagus irregularis DAOM 197198w]POG63261.1 hypothetical protein GLOIN_2v1784270 [Rhizophagus irregularis DAOM 181602=DAOM 197198]UZO06739.1 hypothetical protein OCT59_027049 [Rhizophagus irregularis]GBC22889.1 hypothetical protein GLOIN_2v1784270 [Rhizophagus irregularis DAOM 181602=DAOM 197198]|eukprot:XP_025170127.1 hypothetical protein GLOIN_2v1784270 [Rhizophagus irregularis DAOM 181602=DAOM 197198]
MSCSKIFSGELPELTYDILKYFKNDFSTLYSCILVNRLWCRLTIPLLWENPFSNPPNVKYFFCSSETKKYNFIEIYLHNLNEDLNTKLNEYGIEDNLFPSNTLFNYPSFIKYLNTFEIKFSTHEWYKNIIKTLKPEKRCLIENDDFERLIQMSLFKLFINNETNLNTFEIEIFYNLDYYLNDILLLILQNPNFIHNVKNLNLYICNSFSSGPNKNMIIKNNILKLINLHQNLKVISLKANDFFLYQSLLLTKDYNCSNTLNTITLYGVKFKRIINLDKIFDQLKVLESVHLIYCHPLNTSFIQQITNLNRPFKLKSLIISEIIDESSFQLLLQKCGGYLENFGSEFVIQNEQLFESIIKYCKNIKLLNLSKFEKFENRIIYLLFNLIENLKQSLNYLTIKITDWKNYIEYNSIVLQNLGQILPFKLEYLDLCLHIKLSDFEVFLKNSQDTFIKKLLIKNLEGQDILSCIKKYIMKKKRVKYLAIIDSFESTSDYGNYDYKELVSLKDEVEEFKLYDIKVQSHKSLMVSFPEFTRNY